MKFNMKFDFRIVCGPIVHWKPKWIDEQLVWLGLILAISFHLGDEDDLHATMAFQVER